MTVKKRPPRKGWPIHRNNEICQTTLQSDGR
nr:MAG TPA: hypothetical protein [Caudoviricetes sp.]